MPDRRLVRRPALIESTPGALNRELVLENDVVFGSVNANRRHYEAAAEALAQGRPAGWTADHPAGPAGAVVRCVPGRAGRCEDRARGQYDRLTRCSCRRHHGDAEPKRRRGTILGMAVVTVGFHPTTEPRTAAARDPHPPGFAVFDLDRTLLPGSSLGVFAWALARAGLIHRWDVARHAVHQGVFSARGLRAATLERLCAEMVGAAAGRRQADIAEVADAVAASVVARLYPAARWLVERHVEADDRVVLLSAGPQELVGAVAARLGLPVGLGTVAEVGEDGRYTGLLVGSFCHGDGKLDRLRSVLGPVELRRTTAYGDAASDLPVLRAVARPVAVNPDRALTSEALARRWPIVRFE